MKKLIFLCFLLFPTWIFAQQISDTSYHPKIDKPEYKSGAGPVVFIDEGHYNFHTKAGRYSAFANFLEEDGYMVKEYPWEFNSENLTNGKILVIANALNQKNVEDWFLPTPSAFTNEEIEAVKKWVFKGGSLFLIADHMPMAGAAKYLAAEFGFEFTNGFALDTITKGPEIFNLKGNTLHKSIITTGKNSSEDVDQIVTFTGQGFKIPAEATPILTLSKNYVNFLPDTAWKFTKETPKYSLEGWSQGAYRKYGKGRVVVFGEAAMFTAQLAGSHQKKIGMNSDSAPQNHQLLLNIIHWLDGKLE